MSFQQLSLSSGNVPEFFVIFALYPILLLQSVVTVPVPPERESLDIHGRLDLIVNKLCL